MSSQQKISHVGWDISPQDFLLEFEYGLPRLFPQFFTGIEEHHRPTLLQDNLLNNENVLRDIWRFAFNLTRDQAWEVLATRYLERLTDPSQRQTSAVITAADINWIYESRYDIEDTIPQAELTSTLREAQRSIRQPTQSGRLSDAELRERIVKRLNEERAKTAAEERAREAGRERRLRQAERRAERAVRNERDLLDFRQSFQQAAPQDEAVLRDQRLADQQQSLHAGHQAYQLALQRGGKPSQALRQAGLAQKREEKVARE